MIYKITGQTGNGRCSCGHRVKASEEYYIFTSNRKFSSLCKVCSNTPRNYNTVRVPEDLDLSVIKIK